MISYFEDKKKEDQEKVIQQKLFLKCDGNLIFVVFNHERAQCEV